MKQVLTYFLIVSLGVLFSACGGGSGDTSSETQISDGSSDISAQKIALSWTAPTTRIDGAALSPRELEGYRIYYGNSPENLVLYEDIGEISETERTISVTSPGLYYFAVTAYDSDGLESSFSEIVSKEAS